MNRRTKMWCVVVCLTMAIITIVAAERSQISAHADRANSLRALRVNEAQTRAQVREGRTTIALAIENHSGRELKTRIRVEWLAPDDEVQRKNEVREIVRAGSSVIKIPLPLTTSSDEQKELLWYRLRYRLSSDTSSDASSASNSAVVEGVISLSEIAPDIFELRVIAADTPVAGRRYRAHVRAAHPISQRPVRGVNVSAELKFDNGHDDSFLVQGATDANGYAALDFDLPRELKIEDGKIEIIADKGEFSQTAEARLNEEISRYNSLLISTDKPLYQPGQVLHIRVLAFDFARRAIRHTPLELQIKDPEGTTQFRAELKTSRFGVASADWPIPENTRLGDYSIQVDLDDEESNYSGEAGYTVKISRYDLPNFAVRAKPDKRYYLPGQNAEIEIRADYLFGQPVTRGQVKVVRESSRQWNYREQKWDVEEGEKSEGVLDAKGSFVTKLDLSKAHAEFEDSRWRRFEDVTFAAYVTDETTGRTEQKRFDLRVTREAIHVYAIEARGNRTDGLPLQFYVSASYADGTPASCEISISERIRDNENLLLKKVRTNRYGVAKVSNVSLPRRDDREKSFSLALRAQDGKGASGEHVEDVWNHDEKHPQVRIETDKTLYREGEPVAIRLSSTETRGSVILSVMKRWQLLSSRSVPLRNGRANVLLPWQPEFKNEITVSVSAFKGESHDYFSSQSRTVLYPRNDELKLSVKLDRAQYQPGEEAQASFHAQTADGRAVEGALGVRVIDRAVEERVRTDREFSGNSYGYDHFGGYLGGGDNFAGVTLRDLRKADLTQPLPDGFDLVAEILLSNFHSAPRVFAGEEYERDQSEIFDHHLEKQFRPVGEALQGKYEKTGEYPRDDASLRALLNDAGIRFDELRDPWQMPYHTEFSVEGEQDVLEIFSAGPDKKFDTDDDFYGRRIKRPYFKPVGEKIVRLTNEWIGSGARIALNADEYKAALKQRGFDSDALRDRWDRPYRLRLSAPHGMLQITLRSSGPDGRFDLTEDSLSGDDFHVFVERFNYFARTSMRINEALNRNFRETGSFPETEAELRATLSKYDVSADELRDLWGRDYQPVFARTFRYSDRVVISYEATANANKQRIDLKPVTQQINFITLHSAGEDGQPGTPDDFSVGTFSRLVAEQGTTDAQPQPVNDRIVNTAYSGAIKGVITDLSGAVIPGVLVKVTHKYSMQVYQAHSNAEGNYLLGNLPSGKYELECSAAGFQRMQITDVPVQSSSLTQVNVTLQVGTVSEAVSVTADSVAVQTQSSVHSVVETRNISSLKKLVPSVTQVITKSDVSTPRLREHFQETLIWQPELETDRQGRAQLRFRIADNITTWKMSVIGSTADGEIGMAEKEFLAFQPFFVEHDPPEILTEGDEISLPVVLRNYLDKPQSVDAEIKPESWFTLLSSPRKRAEVKAGDAGKVIFDFRATAAVSEGRQRITAFGNDANDAIEKPVSVHPDGEEIASTVSDVFSNRSTMKLNIPAEAIRNSVRAELKIYPNLLAHALEGIEGILRRPYGCGEQTISSTYPNVMILRHLQSSGEKAPAIEAKAARYTKAGYERLLRYREGDGGFSYWGRGGADLALTAYALRFLNDVKTVADVDADVIRGARLWLLGRQQSDGRWIATYWGEKEDTRRSALTTALIARVLANDSEALREKRMADSLKRALGYLSQRINEIDEPYLTASYALAAISANDLTGATQALNKLRSSAREEAGTTYWNLESNTPFYGWGLAGRVETTALVVRALHAEKAMARATEKAEAPRVSTPGNDDKQTASDSSSDELVNRGLLFLMRNKDPYGVWYSTQATINVLDLFISLNAQETKRDSGGAAEIMVNGKAVSSVMMPAGSQLISPIRVDLSSQLITGINQVEIRRNGEAAHATAQLVETHYIPWTYSTAMQKETIKPRESGGLRLLVSYDKAAAKIGDTINCHVTAERTGLRGYGMLLAEIGLPPGAEVDRASLEKAVNEAGWAVNRYDVLPDRIILYLWPQAGGTKFSFAFRQRCGIRAQTASSSLYDYYNPESRVVVAPTRFVVN